MKLFSGVTENRAIYKLSLLYSFKLKVNFDIKKIVAIIHVQGYSLRQNNWKNMGNVYSRNQNFKESMIHVIFTVIWNNKMNWNKGR